MGIFQLVRNIAVDPVSTLFAVGRLEKIDWNDLEREERFPYNYDEGKIIVLPAEPPLVRCCASGAEVPEGGQPEVDQKYREDFTIYGMFREYARPAWHRYLADGTSVISIPTLEVHNALTKSASPIACTTVAIVAMLDKRPASSPTLSSDEEDRKMDDLIEIDEGERVGMKRHLCNLQDSCCTKKRDVMTSESEGVGLAVE